MAEAVVYHAAHDIRPGLRRIEGCKHLCERRASIDRSYFRITFPRRNLVGFIYPPNTYAGFFCRAFVRVEIGKRDCHVFPYHVVIENRRETIQQSDLAYTYFRQYRSDEIRCRFVVVRRIRDNIQDYVCHIQYFLGGGTVCKPFLCPHVKVRRINKN